MDHLIAYGLHSYQDVKSFDRYQSSKSLHAWSFYVDSKETVQILANGVAMYYRKTVLIMSLLGSNLL